MTDVVTFNEAATSQLRKPESWDRIRAKSMAFNEAATSQLRKLRLLRLLYSLPCSFNEAATSQLRKPDRRGSGSRPS